MFESQSIFPKVLGFKNIVLSWGFDKNAHRFVSTIQKSDWDWVETVLGLNDGDKFWCQYHFLSLVLIWFSLLCFFLHLIFLQYLLLLFVLLFSNLSFHFRAFLTSQFFYCIFWYWKFEFSSLSCTLWLYFSDSNIRTWTSIPHCELIYFFENIEGFRFIDD